MSGGLRGHMPLGPSPPPPSHTQVLPAKVARCRFPRPALPATCASEYYAHCCVCSPGADAGERRLRLDGLQRDEGVSVEVWDGDEVGESVCSRWNGMEAISQRFPELGAVEALPRPTRHSHLAMPATRSPCASARCTSGRAQRRRRQQQTEARTQYEERRCAGRQVEARGRNLDHPWYALHEQSDMVGDWVDRTNRRAHHATPSAQQARVIEGNRGGSAPAVPP